MDRLPHGYTNLTRRLPEGMIEKRYEGPGRHDRAQTERDCLRGLFGEVPVPEIVEADLELPRLVMREAPGRHGQALIDDGRAALVLAATGTLLRRLQETSPTLVPSLAGHGSVISHGDFGPQNLLIDVERDEITAVMDWEFAHIGEPVEDLAWAEWIVRMHHPGAVDELASLHHAAALHFDWSARHEAMLAKCEQLRDYCDGQGWSTGADVWRERIDATGQWVE